MLIITAYLLCAGLFVYIFGEDEIPLVRVKQGLIRGIQEESLNGRTFYSYMSIPYAEPPVENLRFKDPIPSKPWDSVLEGRKMPVGCLQITSSTLLTLANNSLSIIGAEDCLYLNIFTPAPNDPERKLPVMVYIHGGGFAFGAADVYPPYFLMNKNIVLAVIQYRVGIF
ncbi:Venom carboxylesterase-6, partial [Armadillidium nasatum]